jgi:agmatine deiminase
MRDQNDFYMPAEWVEHERTLIEWPVRASLVHPENYDSVCADYASIAKTISKFEPVTMIVNEGTAAEAADICGSGIEFLTIPHNDAWCRDNGPTFLMNQAKILSAMNWRFNAWGEKYLPYDLDNDVAPKVLEHFQVPYFDSSIILEGGSIHVDGEGTLLTTRECLLNQNRNASLTETQITAELHRCLNISKILWLNRGLYGDETDGHVDNVACFARPGVVLLQTCHDPADPNFEITKENLEILQNSTDATGRKLEIFEIPQPPARYYEGSRLTLSYLNFYFVNGGIILPVFGRDAEQADETAKKILCQVFPDRKVVTVDTQTLITEGGNIHCVTQQMPKGIHP